MSAASPKAPTQLSTNPYVGVLGVFLGASIATMNSRLLSVGLADLRGAMGFSFDQASWLPTALNMAMMFSGVFCVFLSVIYGPRRILLISASVFTVTAILLPFSANFWAMLALEVLAGLAPGTFYSLTMTFVLTSLPKRLIIFGIAAYAADIIFTSNIAAALQGWYVDHLSGRWIFWHAALVTPLMMLCVYFGIPRRNPVLPAPSWRGFAYFSLSLSLLFGALDQGERLDWFHSPVIIALTAAGLFFARGHLCQKNTAAESAGRSLLREFKEPGHPGLIDFRFQVRSSGQHHSYPRFSRQHPKISSCGNGPRSRLGCLAPIRRGVAGSCRYSLH